MNKIDELTKAIKYYSQAININPTFHEAIYNLGTVFEKIGKRKEAIKCLKKEIIINPLFYYTYDCLGSLYAE